MGWGLLAAAGFACASAPKSNNVGRRLSSTTECQATPLPAPITHGMARSAIWDDEIPLVMTAYPDRLPGSVTLFAQGVFQPLKGCVLGSHVVGIRATHQVAFSSKRPAVALMVECEPLPAGAHIGHGDMITLLLNRKPRAIVPSSMRWDARLQDEWLPAGSTPRYFLCAATQVRNMAKYLPDWAQYHRRIGVDRIFVYDNNSTDRMREIGGQLDGVEVVPWPWRRSQRQAYTHARLMGRHRCRWMLFMDLDQYITAGDSVGSFAEAVRAADAKGPEADASGDSWVGGVQLRSRSMTTRNILKCPPAGTEVPEAYLDRQHDKTSWDPSTNGLVAPDDCEGLHKVHRSELREGALEVRLEPEQAHFLHYSNKCWREIFYQKFFGRNGVADWNFDRSKVSEDRPVQAYVDLGKQAKVRDTSFRDTKRIVDGMPMPPPNVLPPFATKGPVKGCASEGHDAIMLIA